MTEPLGCWPLSEPFPTLLTDRDLMRVVGLRHSAYYARRSAGAFTFLIARPLLPGLTRYSGRLVERWVRGELGESRFFQGARRRA